MGEGGGSEVGIGVEVGSGVAVGMASVVALIPAETVAWMFGVGTGAWVGPAVDWGVTVATCPPAHPTATSAKVILANSRPMPDSFILLATRLYLLP